MSACIAGNGIGANRCDVFRSVDNRLCMSRKSLFYRPLLGLSWFYDTAIASCLSREKCRNPKKNVRLGKSGGAHHHSPGCSENSPLSDLLAPWWSSDSRFFCFHASINSPLRQAKSAQSAQSRKKSIAGLQARDCKLPYSFAVFGKVLQSFAILEVSSTLVTG